MQKMKNPGFVQKVLMYRALHNQILMSCADGSVLDDIFQHSTFFVCV
jgi:hypothetical protein